MIASLFSSSAAHMTGLITVESREVDSNFHVSQRHDDKSLLGINSRALTLNDCVSDLVKGSAAPCKHLGFGFCLQLNQSWQTAAGASEWICHHQSVSEESLFLF